MYVGAAAAGQPVRRLLLDGAAAEEAALGPDLPQLVHAGWQRDRDVPVAQAERDSA